MSNVAVSPGNAHGSSSGNRREQPHRSAMKAPARAQDKTDSCPAQ